MGAETAFLPLHVEGVGFWSSLVQCWANTRAMVRGELAEVGGAQRRPAPAVLPPNERRRAPDSVLMALEVASEAVAASGKDASRLVSIFTSANGDLAITDAMCSTLASNPALLSPVRFHHSVHNAAAGYWTIASGCMQSSTAVSAFGFSFAAGFLEAVSIGQCEGEPVLLAAYDTQAVGPLSSVTQSAGLLAAALVLSPKRTNRTTAEIHASAMPVAAPELALLKTSALRPLMTNAMADCLPLIEALALGVPAVVTLPLSDGMQLRLDLRF